MLAGAGTIASKIVESFDAHGLTPAQIARQVPRPPPNLLPTNTAGAPSKLTSCTASWKVLLKSTPMKTVKKNRLRAPMLTFSGGWRVPWRLEQTEDVRASGGLTRW